MNGASSGFALQSSEGGGLPAQLRDPVGVLRRGWRWILVGFFAVAIPAVILSRLIPLEYEAASRLALSSKAIPDEFVPNTIVASDSEQFQAIENRVLTRERLTKMIESNEAFAAAREKNDLPSLVAAFRSEIDISKKTLRNARGLERSMEIIVSLVGREPENVASAVNALTDELIGEFVTYRSQQSQVTLDFMKREFEGADESLREHQSKLAAFRAEHRGSLPEEQFATLARLERLESLRQSIVIEMSDLRVQANMPRGVGPVGTQTTPRGRVEAELEALRGIYTDEHPAVQSLQSRLEALLELEATDQGEGDPAGSQDGFVPSGRTPYEQEIASRQARLYRIDREVAQLEELVGRTSKITEEYRALEREEVILQESYTEYLRKVKNAELSRSMELSQQGAQLVRLESAIPPTGPVIPRVVFTAAALALAIVVSLGLCVARELLNPVVIDSEHLEELTSLPTLGSIPPVG